MTGRLSPVFSSRSSSNLVVDARRGMRTDSIGQAPRLALLPDFREEGWPSMDLLADMLVAELQAGGADRLQVERVCPSFRRRFSRLPLLGCRRLAINADRLINRFWDYPSYLRQRRQAFDLFHVCDHSYAQLVHALPAERTGVFCYDLDAFRCLLGPRPEPRPRWFRAMSRRILNGLQKAAVVFHLTNEVRNELVQHGLVDADRLVWAPPGVAAEFNPGSEEQRPLPPGTDGRDYILNVGSCIPRKRIDVLLEVFAALRRQRPDLLLVQIGGDWTREQRQQLDRLDLGTAVVQLRGLERSQLADYYRGALLVVQPSEAEGFGLPLIEGLACGTVVIASDIPIFREVGGDALVLCPVADVSSWCDTILQILGGGRVPPTRPIRLERARRFSWPAHARTLAEHYERLLGNTLRRTT
jgi:glycosyltransferase involved in cell wall biosynthesis